MPIVRVLQLIDSKAKLENITQSNKRLFFKELGHLISRAFCTLF